MIVLAFDFETTGLDKKNDRVIEVGATLYSTEQRRVIESHTYLVNREGVPIPPEVTEKTGITNEASDIKGYQSDLALDMFIEFMDEADILAGQNIRRFDLPVLGNWADRKGKSFVELPFIDTMTDIPHMKGEQLITMCAKRGYLINDAHCAGADVSGVLHLIRTSDFNEVLRRASSPLVVLRAYPPKGVEANRTARELGFRWHGVHRMWWRVTKACDIPEITGKQSSFEIIVEKSVTPEDLED